MLRPYRRQCVVALVMVVVWTGTTLAGPFLVRYGIDQGIKADDGGALNAAVVGYVVVAGISYVAYRFQVLLISRIGESFLRDLRLRVFDHLQRLSMPFYDREKAGVIVSRMTSDVDSLQELVQMGLLMFVSNGLLLVVSVIVLASCRGSSCCSASSACRSSCWPASSSSASRTPPTSTCATASATPCRSCRRGSPASASCRRSAARTWSRPASSAGNRRLFDAHMRSVKISAWYLPVIELAGLLTTAIAVGIGGWWVHTGELTIGTVTFFILTLSNLFEPIQQLSQLFNIVQSAGAALSKLFELLDTPVDVPERQGAVDLPERGDIEVEGVGFAYVAGKPVLTRRRPHHPGRRPHRAGRAHRRRQVDPRQAHRPALRPDRGGGPVRRHRPPRRHAALAAGARRGRAAGGLPLQRHDPRQRAPRPRRAPPTTRSCAALDDDRRASSGSPQLPEGLDTEVRERGSRLSAGEKQLVSLARAALADPAVLVLDEATSSLDPGTELVVEHAMVELMEGRTVIVIAHRLSTAERCDLVGVVAEGRLLELGTHADLVAQGERYAALFATWSGGIDGPGIVTIAVGEIHRSPERPADGCHRPRPLQVQAGVERRRGLRLQAQEGPERGHHPARCPG